MRRILEGLIVLIIAVLMAQIAWAADVEMKGNVAVTGSVTAASFSGSGAGLTTIPGSAISSLISNSVNTTQLVDNSVTTGKLGNDSVTPGKIAFYGRVAIVAISGGDYANPAAAMTDYSSWCGSPSAANPCLLKLMPGVYNIGTSSVIMQPYIDIEGSGENVTVIQGSIDSASAGVVTGANNAQLRFLTVTNSNSGNAVAIYNNATSPAITFVTANATGNVSYGIVNTASSAPNIKLVTINSTGTSTAYGVKSTSSSPIIYYVTITASAASAYGIYNESSTAGEIHHLTINATGTGNAYGLYNNSSSIPDTRHITIYATANGGNAYGVYNSSSSPDLKHVEANAAGSTAYCYYNLSSSPTITRGGGEAIGTTSTYGVYNNASSPNIKSVFVSANGLTGSNYGVANYTSGTVKIDLSLIKGATTISNGSGVTTFVGGSQLKGGVSSNAGTLTCAGIYDGNYGFHANSCP
jgi:hypothetical protein